MQLDKKRLGSRNKKTGEAATSIRYRLQGLVRRGLVGFNGVAIVWSDGICSGSTLVCLGKRLNTEIDTTNDDNVQVCYFR